MAIIPQPRDKEEIQPREPLLERRHLSEPTATAPARAKEHSGWRLSLNKHGRAHLDPPSQTATVVTKEPVLRDGKAGVVMEHLYQKLAVPERYGAVREPRTPTLPRERSLEFRDLVLHILGPLAPIPHTPVGADALDHISITLGFVHQPVPYNRKVGRDQTIVVDQQNILERLGGVAPDELGDDLGPEGRLDVVHAVGSADGLGVIEWSGRVAVRDDEDVRRREDLQGGLEGGANDGGGLVTVDQEGGVQVLLGAQDAVAAF